MNKLRQQSQSQGAGRSGHDPLVFALVLVAAGLFFFRLGEDSIRSINEGYYAEGAREMLESGDWLTPHFNYEPRFWKPPLNYWLIAVCYKAFGVSELTTRLPCATAAALSLLVTYGIGKALFDKRVALLGALALGTGLGHIHTAQSATPGIVFTFFIWLSLLGFVKAYVKLQGSTPWLFVAYAAAGLAVLTKGPGGIVLPGLAGLLFLLVNRDIGALKRLGLWWGLPLAVLMPAAWYASVAYQHGAEAMRIMLLEENIYRFASYTDERGLLFYPAAWPVEFFPWALLIVPAAVQALSPSAPGGEGRTGLRFCWAAVIGWFIFFSIARNKSAHYIMPLHLPTALAVAHMFAEAAGRPARSGAIVRALACLVATGSILLVVAAVAFVLVQFAPYERWERAFAVAPALVAAIILIGLRGRAGGTPKLPLVLACVMLAFEVFLSAHVWPRIETARPYRELGAALESHPCAGLVAYGMGRPTRTDGAGPPSYTVPLAKTSLPFYARQRVEPIHDAGQLRALLWAGRERMCVAIDEREFGALRLSRLPGVRILGRWRYLPGPDGREVNVLSGLRPGQSRRHVLLVSQG